MVRVLSLAVAIALLVSCGDNDAGPVSSIGTDDCSEVEIHWEGDFSVATPEDLEALAGDGNSCLKYQWQVVH